MNIRIVCSLLALTLAALGAACNKTNPDASAEPMPAGVEEHAHADGPEPEAGHAEAAEPSDLDRPVEELAAMTCEHGMKTHACAECRYEAGFVRAPASLLEGGLFTTTNPERRKVVVPLPLTGEVQFDERRVGHVGTQVEGVITRVHVVLGEQVRKGQPLLDIESIAVGEGQAAYREAQGLLELARRNFERVSALRRESIASEREYLQAQQELAAAEIRAAGAAAKLTRLGVVGKEDGRIVLVAPMDGSVLLMHAVAGEVARTEESLVTIGDNSSVWVWADLYERDIAAVRAGQAAQQLTASVSVKAYPGQEFPGVVDPVSPAMDESSRTVKVRIQVRNDDGRLLAGMFADVDLFLPGAEEALTIPGEAVLTDEGRDFVFVHYQGEDYVRRPVEVGRRWADWVEITEGLQPSQVVVADGAFLMKSDVLRSKMGAGCAD